jgi:hypothetical protein
MDQLQCHPWLIFDIDDKPTERTIYHRNDVAIFFINKFDPCGPHHDFSNHWRNEFVACFINIYLYSSV